MKPEFFGYCGIVLLLAVSLGVKQSSSPDAEGGANDSNDVDGPLLYQVIAEYLMQRAGSH